VDTKARRARAIQENIRKTLMHYWDPINVSGVPEAQGEYDSYIGRVYRLVASKAPVDDITDLLCEIEYEWMGLKPNREGLKNVAIKLHELNVSL
jgi:hypothetical protein